MEMSTTWTVVVGGNFANLEAAVTRHAFSDEAEAKLFARDKLKAGHVVRVVSPTGKVIADEDLITWLTAPRQKLTPKNTSGIRGRPPKNRD